VIPQLHVIGVVFVNQDGFALAENRVVVVVIRLVILNSAPASFVCAHGFYIDRNPLLPIEETLFRTFFD
jgi:hypothetical protein